MVSLLSFGEECQRTHRSCACFELFVVTLFYFCDCGESARAAKFVPLGDLPGGSFQSSSFGVSADGSVVVGIGDSTSGQEAFRWTSDGGMAALGDLPGGIFYSLASRVSADGSVVVGFGNSTSGQEAFRWTSTGGLVSLGDLAGGLVASRADGVFADGSVVIGTGNSTSGFEAFRWTSGGGMVGLGDLSGGSFSSKANGLSADGLVIVGFGNSTSGQEAFRWTSGGGMVGLGDLTGGSFSSQAQGVSADGSVIVGSGSSTSGIQAFRWTSGGGMAGLGDLPGGAFFSSASDVSADGSVVVGVGASAIGLEAFIWDAGNGMRNLKGVLMPSVGVALNGWTLQNALAVSYDGRTVVGTGTNPAGFAEAWLAYLADQVFWFPNTSGSWDVATNWSGPFFPSPTDDVVLDPTTAVTITGPAAHTTINSLTIGSNIASRVTLNLSGATRGDLNVLGTAILNTNAEVVLADGRTLSAQFTVINSGILRGTGTVNASLLNEPGGEVRVAAGESLVVGSGGHTNQGKMEVIGGSLEVIGFLNNSPDTSLVTGRDATLRFRDGLGNSNSLSLTGGNNDVFGDIINQPTGRIVVSGGAGATFYDDIVQDGTFRVSKVGTTTSVAVVLGSFSGSGGSTGGGDIFFEGDLRPGNSPALVTFSNNIALGSDASLNIELGGLIAGTQYDRVNVTGSLALGGSLNISLFGGFTPSPGNVFDILDFNPATLTGTFDSIVLPSLTSGLTWNTSQLYSTGTLSVSLAGDFDLDGDVDGKDFIIWQQGGSPDPLSSSDLALWQAQYGSALPLFAAKSVPEPGFASSCFFSTLFLLKFILSHRIAT